MKGKPLFVRAEWDEEARVWVATSDEVPGLTTEAGTLETLIEKLKVIIGKGFWSSQRSATRKRGMPCQAQAFSLVTATTQPNMPIAF